MFNIQSYQKATTVNEALALLQKEPRARLLAGGTDVLVKLHKGKPGFDYIVDIHDVAELSQIELTDAGDLNIGPGCTFAQVMASEPVLAKIPVLADALSTIGGPQVRNMGTIGGNLCNGVPSADSATPLFAANAELTIAGPEGQTTMPITDFFLGPSKVALKQDQILTNITITQQNLAGYYGHFHKYAMREAMDISTIGCTAVCRVDEDRLADLRLAYGVAAPVPIRCRQTEEKAQGRKLEPALLDDIAATVIDDVTPRTSWRATKEFRLQIITTLARRVVAEAITKAGGTL